ncbi:murein DD-endopeptidase MepM/ murein hydrolase activator NlpD [Hydrogenispora ethanolica]|uniref:Murein DD-endopeptidase MepM/ murein hydrolase activator NlpD n=1 Tax=Hydrogenispora ethanolica TaxID=1082276 RepID=A0A4R1RZQ0_HYDET|nr:peptidoglycan DD-metalloendopeptidase family protein [Hydrogenispora ethanolica]TCL72335.1 murein DD-endopeptidase MepM/ murein hydrolase activator NlpD [Hydrogenispora ethanolica]
MLKTIRKVTLLLLIVSFSAAALPSRVWGAETSRQRELKQLIQKTQTEIVNKKKKERSVMSNLFTHQQNLEQVKQNYRQVQTQLSQVQNQYELSKRQLAGLQQNVKQLEQDRDERQAQLNRRLVAMYKYGPQNYLRILLEARDFADLLSRFSMFAYIVRNDLSALDRLESAKAAVQKEQRRVETKTVQVAKEFQQVTTLKEQVSQKQQEIAAKVDSTKEELQKIQADRARLEKALAEYEATSRQIEEQIRRQQQRSTGGTLGSGKFIWPARGRISDIFGWRYHPILKTKRFHNGEDIAVPTGTPVHAADGGVVLVSGWQGGYGYFVAIDHGNGISTCYGHNSRLLVRVGQRVQQGDVIAYSGSTGLSTGPHIHFEVRVKGVPVDPRKYLP